MNNVSGVAVVDSFQQLENVLSHRILRQARRFLFQDLEKSLVDEFKYQVEFALPF